MKEFHSNNFYLEIFSDNSSLYYALRNKLEIFYAKDNIQILKDVYCIYTREHLSTDYLALKLVADNIPSLLFEINPFRQIPKEFLKKKLKPEMILSDLACILLIESILLKEKKIKANKKVLRQLAGDIFQFWKDSLISYSVKEEKVPSNIKEEYDSVIRKFIKSKGNKKIEIEYLYEACAGGKSCFLSKEEAIEKFGEEIILYGVSEMDPLHLKVLEILSVYVKVIFLIPAPRLGIVENKEPKLKELLSDWSILNRLLGDKNLTDVEKILEFQFLSIPEKAKLLFYESQEAYREIEFVGREILRLIEEHKRDETFQLTSIKLILPADDLNYSLLVNNTFDRMGIPHSFTKDIRRKKSPYISAIFSLLKLSLSDFDKDSVFSLFYNPCFYPILDEIRIAIKPEIWNQIISRMNLSGFLDKYHRKNLGYRESNLMTWESLWNRLNSILIGDTSEDSIVLETELLEEAIHFLEISSSLLQDLIGFKEDFSTLNEFSKFFKILLDTYLHPSMRYNKIEETERINERLQTRIYSLLESIGSIESELNSIHADTFYFTLDDFADILTGLIDSLAGGDARVLKNGVVVGELLDVIDPSFDFVFLVGMDERRFNSFSKKHETVMADDSALFSRKDSTLKLKNYFYHIFNHNAKRYSFSYVSLDTIKDRQYYPARELEKIRLLVSKDELQYKKIPLFSYLEYKMDPTSRFDKETLDLIELKKKESSLLKLKNSFPDWEFNCDLSLSKEIDSLTSEKILNKKLKTYFFRSDIDKEYMQITQNTDLSVNRFINYIDCPKKYFFNYSMHIEEETEVQGEVEELDSIRRHTFIKEVFAQLRKNPNLNTDEIIENIFSLYRIESGEIPYGVLGKMAEFDFREYMDIYLLPFFYETLSTGFQVQVNALFQTDASKTLDSIVFSTPMVWDKLIKAKVDLLLLSGDTLYLTYLTTSKKITDKKRIIAGFTAHILNESEHVVKEVCDFFGIKKMHVQPSILHFPKKDFPKLHLGQLTNSTEDLFKPYWKSLLENQYPAFPLDSKNCGYCPVNTICHGYQNGFQPFLEKEMMGIIHLSKEIFA